MDLTRLVDDRVTLVEVDARVGAAFGADHGQRPPQVLLDDVVVEAELQVAVLIANIIDGPVEAVVVEREPGPVEQVRLRHDALGLVPPVELIRGRPAGPALQALSRDGLVEEREDDVVPG